MQALAWYLIIWQLHNGLDDFFKDFENLKIYDEAVIIVQAGLFFLHIYYLAANLANYNTTQNILVPFAAAQVVLAVMGLYSIFTDTSKTLDQRDLIEILFVIAPIISSFGVWIMPNINNQPKEETQYYRIVKV